MIRIIDKKCWISTAIICKTIICQPKANSLYAHNKYVYNVLLLVLLILTLILKDFNWSTVLVGDFYFYESNIFNTIYLLLIKFDFWELLTTLTVNIFRWKLCIHFILDNQHGIVLVLVLNSSLLIKWPYRHVTTLSVNMWSFTLLNRETGWFD